MEHVKSFEDLVREEGGKIEPCVFSDKFIKEYESYMTERILLSRKMHSEAIQEARNIWVY